MYFEKNLKVSRRTLRSDLLIKIYIIVWLQDLHFMHMTLGRALHQKSESKSRNRVSARAKLEVSNVFYAYFILKQKNVKYGVFYCFSAVSFNYGKGTRIYR